MRPEGGLEDAQEANSSGMAVGRQRPSNQENWSNASHNCSPVVRTNKSHKHAASGVYPLMRVRRTI